MPRLSAPQNIFLNGLNTKFRAYVGGFGSGKTFVGCLDLLLFAGKHTGLAQAYYGPTYAYVCAPMCLCRSEIGPLESVVI